MTCCPASADRCTPRWAARWPPIPSLSASGRSVAAELAAHWSAAHDLPAAFAASAQAGEEAERMAAFAEANAHFERAAELWDAVSDGAACGQSRPGGAVAPGCRGRSPGG